MTTKAKLDQWNIAGIEFEAKSAYDPEYTGKLPVGIVRNPNDPDLFFFSRASFAETELDQLVGEGYLVLFYPAWLLIAGCFCVRLALDKEGQGKFYLVPDWPRPEECNLCEQLFPFINNGTNVYESAPARGPSYGCGGDPPEYDIACTPCLEREDDGYDEEPDEEDLWEARGWLEDDA